jgi:tetratricopeptide (TPR) repeat protein
MVTANSVSTALAVSIAERKGDYERSMTLARRSAGDNPRGTDAWLLLAQTAMLAAKATDEKRARDILLAEAKEALDKALVNSKESNLSAYRLRIQFQASFFDEEGIRRELDRTLQSNVPEPSRSLFVGRTFLRLSDPKSALEVFERLRKITPDSPDVYLGLAEYYRNQRNDEQNIRMLEEALSRGLTRTDIRSRLALGLALRQTGSIPWQRIKDLVGEQDSSIGSNELLHALILINKGDDARKQRAAEILARIRESGQSNTDDATRMLAALETERWVLRRKEKASKEADISLARARELYIELTRRPKPSAMDLYKFGDLLLRADQTNELRKVANQLDRTAAGSAISLDLRLRLAKKSGDQEKADRLAEEWADRAIASGALLKSNAWGSVGQTLTRLGFHDEALEWLAKAYEADHRFYRDYVVGLARDQQYLLATDICKSELTDTSNPEALALMVDVMVLAGTGTTFPEENEKLIATATKQSQQVPRVIESIATLRLSQQRYVDAVRLYEQAEKLAPKNVRILNNLAMALSEIPGRETEAIPKIESAIAFFGRSPELLDTQGLVLLRNDMPVAATAVLREATAVSNDPRYRFHLIMALLENGDKKGAISNWAQLDLRQLSKLPLTPGELTDLESLKKTFESNT